MGAFSSTTTHDYSASQPYENAIMAVAGPPENTEEIGQTIGGRYTVEAVLGRGGMGAVYRVRDARSGERLALKRGCARDPRKAQKRKALLEREYHTLSQLAHPRIIEVYDYGIDEVGPYYTMELLDGADLDRGGRMRVARGMRGAARRRVVARDPALARLDASRRVGAQRAHAPRDGRAKLIDFGAMASMGVAKDVVGTPPFVAPEVLQMQALDARADLFSLGALGYFLLSGRHAYPARRIARAARRVALAAASAVALRARRARRRSIALIMRVARARSRRAAAERGRGDGAPVRDRRHCRARSTSTVSRAYLTTPTLVGRERAMVAVRRRMLSLARGDGGVLLVEGEAGSGRSRLLDACALEGKLLGASVRARRRRRRRARRLRRGARARLAAGRAAAGAGARVAAAVARRARPRARRLAERRGTRARAAPERSVLIRELRDFILSLARDARIVLVVDDADRIDEPSAALLAALAHKTERHALIVALAVDRDQRVGELAGAARDALGVATDRARAARSRAERGADALGVRRRAESAADRRAHSRAVAGQSARDDGARAAPRVSAGWRAIEAGRWSLPASLDAADLPSTLAMSLAARLADLSADARELADVLCLADGDGLTSQHYAQLTAHGDAKRVFAALDELVSARVLMRGRRALPLQPARLPAACCTRACRASAARAIHGRLADLLASHGGDAVAPRASPVRSRPRARGDRAAREPRLGGALAAAAVARACGAAARSA